MRLAPLSRLGFYPVKLVLLRIGSVLFFPGKKHWQTLHLGWLAVTLLHDLRDYSVCSGQSR